MKTFSSRLTRLGALLRRSLLVTIWCGFLGFPNNAAMAGPPDLCSATLTPGRINVRQVSGIGDSLTVRWVSGNVADRKVAVIFNGNSYGSSDYVDLAEHLTLNGFVTAVAQRPGGIGGNGAYVIDAILGTLSAVNINPSDAGLRIALVGHSMGGQLAVTGANHNLTLADPLPIFSVVGLSARGDASSFLSGTAAASYLGIYGSQDEDLDGFGGTVREAFRAYDQASNESTTTCNSPPCLQINPTQDKTMVFVNGADHAGLVGKSAHFSFPPLPQTLNYIDAGDQLCLVQAYVTSFLRWKLFGESQFEGFLRDDWRPPSVANMVTADVDGLGNPVGTPIRIASQISPRQRKVIHNFQVDATPSADFGPVFVLHAPAGTLSGSPQFIRHHTGLAMVLWQPAPGGARAVWTVPAGSRVGSTYSHFAIRLGLVQGIIAPFNNPLGVDRQLQVWLRDNNGLTSQHTLTVPYSDPYTLDGRTRSTMSTFRIPITDIQGIDLNNVTTVEIALSAFGGGAFMVDSMEWHRD